MATPGQARVVYDFGTFRLDVGERLLLQSGRPVALRAKVFDTLRVLVQNGGRLVSKDDLIKAVWPDTIVEDNNLAHNIATLRRVLGEKDGGEKYIETVPRRGYRFVAEVREPRLRTDQTTVQTPRRQSSPPALVQRESELLRLRTLLEEALQGTRRIVFVTGEAGLGKTSLVQAFLAETGRREGVLVGQGQCLEHRGEGEPYLPVLEAVGRLCHEPGGGRLVELLGRHAPSWLVQMPWLVGEQEFQTLRQKVLGTTQPRMLREMVEAVEALTAEAPLVLVLEDLHWSDYSTLDLLCWLARRQEPARLLLLATFRPADAKRSGHPLHAAVQELKLRALCEELSLPFLTELAVGEYLESRFPTNQFPPGLASLIHRRTEGNPLFVVTLVDHWVGRGSVAERDSLWKLATGLEELAVAVPEGLRQFIEQQLDRLDACGRRVLEAASVAGKEFSATVVAAGAGLTVEEVECILATLAEPSQFIRACGVAEGPDASARYGFVHDLYREILYERVPATRRARMHHQVGMTLEGAGSGLPAPASDLALHFVRGRDPVRAARYLRLAAEQAIQRNTHREAIGYLTTGLNVIRGLPEGDERDRCELALQAALGPVLIATKGWAAPDVESTLVRARQLCQHLGEPPEVFPVTFGLAAMHEFRGNYRQSQELLEERLRLPSQSPNGGSRLESHLLLACSLFHQGIFTGAIEHAERGLEIYNPEHHLALLAGFGENPAVACHAWAALSLWFLGYTDQALERATRALVLASEPFHLYSLAHAQLQAALLHQLRQEPALARHRAEAAINLATERGFPYHVATGSILRGWALVAENSHQEGFNLLRQGMAACRSVGAELDRPYHLALLADACSRLGRPEDGLFAIAEALDMVRQSRSFFYEAELHRLMGALLLQTGLRDHSTAEECFRRALDIARRQSAKSLELRAAASLESLEAFRRQASGPGIQDPAS